ncbi:MAG TPA: hypothetical protein GXX28_01925 [Firmicutes bacterium]|nr:hypothetical protein [Bacillota bacterium]
MLEIRVNVSDHLLKDRRRWLKLRSLLLDDAGETQAIPTRRRGRRPGSNQEVAPTPETAPASGEAQAEPPAQTPRLTSNLQKAAYALQRLHESSPNPSGYTARQMALFLREQNIEAISAEQLSWALATLVSRRQSPDKLFAQRIRRGRYLPTEHTRELFA